MAESKSPLAQAVQSLPNLPTAAKPGLVRGLSYLLGGVGNYLGAWLRRPVQAVEDRTDARTLITKAVALAAADKLSHDPNVVAAAIAQWGPADLNRQVNKMKIARDTIIELSAVPDESNAKSAFQSDSEITDDFLNSFERFCSDSSDENMQKLWARLLAGEIKRPGSFSRHTMRCLYEVDPETAQLFERVAMKTVGGVLLSDHDDEIKTSEINTLQAAGLITGAGGIFNYTAKFDENGIAMLRGKKYLLLLKRDGGVGQLTMTSHPLSQAGEELLSLIPNYDEGRAMRELGQKIPAAEATEIHLTQYEVDGEKLNVVSTEAVRTANGDAGKEAE